MSMTQRFIDFSMRDKYDTYLYEISKNEFEQFIKEHNAKKECAYQILDNMDIPIHPMQKVYLLEDYYCSYPSGGSDWRFRFVFKYKEKYYYYVDADGS